MKTDMLGLTPADPRPRVAGARIVDGAAIVDYFIPFGVCMARDGSLLRVGRLVRAGCPDDLVRVELIGVRIAGSPDHSFVGTAGTFDRALQLALAEEAAMRKGER